MEPLDLARLETYPLESRPSKVSLDHLGQPVSPNASLADWLEHLPRQLAANELRRLRDLLISVHTRGGKVAAAIGGHVIKTGCAPYLIDWLERGVLSGIAMNGSAAIHDLELALAGKTSEDVASQLHAGRFGMARETADLFAQAARLGRQQSLGLGQALAQVIEQAELPYRDASLVLAAHRSGRPCTIHVALGTDIVHMHPQVSGADLGETSLLDFRILCRLVSELVDGVWLNIGSAVVMPEVFLKVVSVVRNLGYELGQLTCVNLDKEAKYRTRMNVLSRPGAAGIELIGHHEILIPLLHLAVASGFAATNSIATQAA